MAEQAGNGIVGGSLRPLSGRRFAGGIGERRRSSAIATPTFRVLRAIALLDGIRATRSGTQKRPRGMSYIRVAPAYAALGASRNWAGGQRELSRGARPLLPKPRRLPGHLGGAGPRRQDTDQAAGSHKRDEPATAPAATCGMNGLRRGSQGRDREIPMLGAIVGSPRPPHRTRSRATPHTGPTTASV